ncbi:MAG: tripartite tricarboxylate transporter substrate binding protein [Lautropia sp.]
MKTPRRLALAATAAFAIAFALAASLVPSPAAAQTAFPSKPLKIIVPNAPGGSIDIMARLFQQHLSALWGQPVVIDYKPGAGTVLGTDIVAKSDPDGHTLGFIITSHVINPTMRKLPFDTVKDLSGVTMYGVSHILISASPEFPGKTLGDVIAAAKKDPEKYSYASPGSGSSMHMAGELLKQTAGIKLLHVPFKGNAPAFIEVIAGRIQFIIDPVASSLQFVKDGRLKPIAITNATRSPALPEVPTVAETFPGFSVQSFFGVVVPSKTPRDVVAKLNEGFRKVVAMPEMQAKLRELGMEPVGNSAEEFDAFIRAEIPKWQKVVDAAGIKAD